MKIVLAAIAYFLAVSSYSGPTIPSEDIYCIAETVYVEARGEPIMGQVAVAHVIMNRVGNKGYPNTVCGVVYQEKQFSGVKGEYLLPKEEGAWKDAVEVAIMAYTGFVNDPTGGALNYYANKGKNALAYDPWPQLRTLMDIGNHRFKTVAVADAR